MLGNKYTQEILDLFGSKRAREFGLVAETWDPEDVRKLIHAASSASVVDMSCDRWKQQPAWLNFTRFYRGQFLRELEQFDVSPSYTQPSGHSVYHSFTIDTSIQPIDCLKKHKEKSTLISSVCADAISQGVAKLTEVQCDGHTRFLVNMLNAWSVMLLPVLGYLFKARKQLEKSAEEKRRILQQELDDPALRQWMENRLANVPEEARRDIFARREENIGKLGQQSKSPSEASQNDRPFPSPLPPLHGNSFAATYAVPSGSSDNNDNDASKGCAV